MNPVGTSSVAFVTLTGLFWGGWVVGSQTPEGQIALAKAYASFAAEAAAAEQAIYDPSALRAVVCGVGPGMVGSTAKPCLAVVAAGRVFIVDAGSGAALALEANNIQLQRLEAVLLTGSDAVRAADLDELWVRAIASPRGDKALPVYGPTDSHDVVKGLNIALKAQGAQGGLEPWAPAPEPGRSVIVFEGDGLVVSAFTTEADAIDGRIGYRFDYRGRSLVVAGDGRAEWAQAAQHADVVLHGGETQLLAQLHDDPIDGLASAAQRAGAGMLVMTGVDPNPMIADMQVRQARRAGLDDVIAGRLGMLVELPLTSQEVTVRRL